MILYAEGMVVSIGFVDLHCHLRQPGFEEKETIATGTQAAARGGFTTVCCMANTTPPIDSRAVVEFIQRNAAASGLVRVLPIGCITKGLGGKQLAKMGELAEAGVVAYSDDGQPVADYNLMRRALDCGRNIGLPVIDHCEDLSLSQGGVMNEGSISTKFGLQGIPSAAEEIVVARDIALSELTGARVHIAHVSTAGSVDLIRRAKERGISVTAEVTPHHLTLTEENVVSPLAYNTNAKVKPPLRTADDLRSLTKGLRDGVIDAIATDHAPHTNADKKCEFTLAAFGISGLETALGSLMTLVHSGELDLVTLISKLTIAPARIIGVPLLGTMEIGAYGDVTLFDPQIEWVVDPDSFASKGKNTPLAGERLKGKVMATIYGGEVVYRDHSVKLGSSLGS